MERFDETKPIGLHEDTLGSGLEPAGVEGCGGSRAVDARGKGTRNDRLLVRVDRAILSRAETAVAHGGVGAIPAALPFVGTIVQCAGTQTVRPAEDGAPV
ncbi:hypothetical protein [Micromonospora sp. 067-2]|uniref:hypothetical protein n=1 Tax=Micromonospora sp. 067-2 TaxID=2789270 RepID=UPI00397E3F7D